MKRSLVTLLVLASALFALPTSLAQPAQASATPLPPLAPLGAASGVLVDLESGLVLWSKDHVAVRSPASLTKIMTALVVIENAKLDDTATITPEARAIDGGRMYAEAGWNFSVEELLWGLLLQSGNDAAVALAQKVGGDGGYPRFIELMNAKAVEIGTTSTQFKNPHGLDEVGHVSTARDLALISMAAMKNQTLARMVAAKTHDVRWGDGAPHTFINHNKLLFRYSGAVGIKTGFTATAGNSLASAVTRDGNTLIAVVLGTPDHYADSIALYDWGFANLQELRANSVERLQPSAKSIAVEEEEKPLEIVEIDEVAEAVESAGEQSGYPLLPPLGALAAALVAALAIRKRRVRTRAAFASVDEFRRSLHALGSRAETILPSSPADVIENGHRDVILADRTEADRSEG